MDVEPRRWIGVVEVEIGGASYGEGCRGQRDGERAERLVNVVVLDVEGSGTAVGIDVKNDEDLLPCGDVVARTAGAECGCGEDVAYAAVLAALAAVVGVSTTSCEGEGTVDAGALSLAIAATG